MDDIQYIEAYGLYSKIHTATGIFSISRRISTLPEELPKSRFVRIHKSFIINTSHLRRLEAKQVWLNATKLPIGITYRTTVQDQLNQLGGQAKLNK